MILAFKIFERVAYFFLIHLAKPIMVGLARQDTIFIIKKDDSL